MDKIVQNLFVHNSFLKLNKQFANIPGIGGNSGSMEGDEQPHTSHFPALRFGRWSDYYADGGLYLPESGGVDQVSVLSSSATGMIVWQFLVRWFYVVCNCLLVRLYLQYFTFLSIFHLFHVSIRAFMNFSSMICAAFSNSVVHPVFIIGRV